MLTHEEMVGLQVDRHDLINASDFPTTEAYVLHLIHTAAYNRAARLVKAKRVLDLGCNTGYGTNILSSATDRVVGADVSEKALSAARNAYGKMGIEFHRVDGHRLPFDEHAFDAIVCFQVLEHVVDCGAFVHEIRRVLAPGGVLILSTPNADIRLDPGMKPWNEFHAREFGHGDLESLLATFFTYVTVYGLFAEKRIYSIEVHRLARMRKKARRRSPAHHPFLPHLALPEDTGRKNPAGLASVVSQAIPRGMKDALRDLRDRHQLRKARAFARTHGVSNLFYRTEGLASALDLLAVCCDDAKAAEQVRHEIQQP